jgi:predicted transposase/invertase (TIGR01784 family)
MQMFWSEAFNNRMVFNAGKAYVRQLNKNEEYDILKPVYTLALINDIFDHKTADFYHHYQIVNRENTEEIIHGLEFVLVELPKFSPQSWKDRKLAVLWLRFLNEVGENMKSLPPELEANEDIRQAAELCEEAAFSQADLDIYDAYWDAVRVERTIKYSSFREGEATGLKKVVINSHHEGIAVETIATITNLTVKQVLKIIEDENRANPCACPK